MNREKVIRALNEWKGFGWGEVFTFHHPILEDSLALLKEQDERLRKLQKDKDKLCLDVSEWKHKFHDAPPKFVSQGVVDQIRWERDTALSQLEQIGKGLGSKMDDIVALLKEQEAVEPRNTYSKTPSGKFIPHIFCGNCDKEIYAMYTFCPYCGKPISWTRQEGR